MASVAELTFQGAFDQPAIGRETPRRVLHLINGEHYSGAERVQDLLAMRLPAEGFEVEFACLKSGRFLAMRQSQDTACHQVAMRSRFDLGTARAVARLIRQREISILHTHTPRTAMIGCLAAGLARVPFVHHVHSPTTADSSHGLRNRLNAIIETGSLSRAAGVIAVSRSVAKYALRQGLHERRVHVVPNGVPTPGPLGDRQPPSGAWTLGMVALFRPRKGLEVALDALALLRDQGLPVRLRAIGSFETAAYEADIRWRAEQLSLQDAIDWVGFTQDVQAELQRLDLLVLPSLYGEGLPMVVLEAMAAGVPVVATRVEGAPEAIRDGVDGLIAAPGDCQDLTRAILKIVHGEADWRLLRTNAHKRQAEKFSDASMARGVADVYRAVLDRAAAASAALPLPTTLQEVG